MNTDPVTGEELESAPPADETTASAPAENSEEALQAEVEKFKDLALRSRAEFDNYRKRAVREKEEAIRYANSSLLEKLLPVLDNFELGLGVAKNSPEGASIVEGLDMVRKQMDDFLRDHGVELLVTEGQAFDPNLHEAVGQEASETVEEGHIVRQLRKGYKIKERLLRPSIVIVSKGSN